MTEFHANSDGAAIGILQWVRHGFPARSVYENRPNQAGNWWPAFRPFADPVTLAKGDSLTIAVESKNTMILIDLAHPSEG